MPFDPVEQTNQRLLAFLERLTTTWTDHDTGAADSLDNVALYMLCGAGLLELRMQGRAWTDQSALGFEATVSGVWLDVERHSLLPEELRRTVPAWSGKAVAVELQPKMQMRLTIFGQENQREAAADSSAPILFAAFVSRHPVVGKVRVRILGNQTPAPGAVAQDLMTDNGLVAVHREILATQKLIAAALCEMNASKSLAAPAVTTPVAVVPVVPTPPVPPQSSDTEPLTEEFGEVGGPQPDPLDSRKVLWAGKNMYLGAHTARSRLFWLLARPIGRAYTQWDVLNAIDGEDRAKRPAGHDERKARQRIRKAVSELRAALREAKLDEHVTIVREGSQSAPEYAMVSRFR
ncbi:MAG: hypothetical protein WCI73_07495 [Phycisphaerae bacterium]